MEKYVKLHRMFQTGDTLVVGVSGGADSVCLLSVLQELKEKYRLRLVCAHVNHMFRTTALRDEMYVEALCKDMGIPCRIKRVDVKKIAEEENISFEEAGRNIRYAFFRELKDEFCASSIAVAHNKDDCSETVLFHLFRGSHLKGLGGIAPVRDDIIRPLTDCSRKEIEEYLRDRNIKWMNDETNASTEYTRNYIRHEIIPAAERVCPGACQKIAENAEVLRETESYLAEQTKAAQVRCCEKKDGGIYIVEKELRKEHPLIVSRVLYHVLEQECEAARDLCKVHVQELTALFDLQSGKQLSFPAGVYAYRTTDGVLVRKERNGISGEVAVSIGKSEDTGNVIRFELEGLGEVSAVLLYDFQLENIPQKTYTKWFDYDKIIKCAVFRRRKEGDFLTINEAGNRKKLKEYFIQEKIPAYKRDEVWVLADDNHIMWIPGYRMSSFYKVDEQTKRVLKITIGGKEDE